MRLPGLPFQKGKQQQQIIQFGGLNFGQNFGDGEVQESFNLSSAQFPTLSQRKGRKTHSRYGNASGIYARGALCVVDGTDLIYDGEVVGQLTEGEKQFATINTKIVIWPDKVLYDTESGKLEPLEAQVIAPAGTAVFAAASVSVPATRKEAAAAEEAEADGYAPDDAVTAYRVVSVDPVSGAVSFGDEEDKVETSYRELEKGLFLQAEGAAYWEVVSIEAYSVEDEETGETTEYVRLHYTPYTVKTLANPSLNTLFSVGDAVHIEGSVWGRNNQTPIVRGVSSYSLTFEGTAFATGTDSNEVTISRKVPDFSCICECDNRIWGGEGSTIWASALGDPKNFYVYDGLSTDSYAVAVGSDGEFTGCIDYGSTVLFWKEHCVHKILGNYPAQYEIYTYTVQGVQAGSHKSMVIIDETLFYKGRGGILRYNGGAPQLISENFGMRRYQNAVAGTDTERYYVSMQDAETGDWGLFVYDTLRGIWLQEDSTHVADFVFLEGELYGLNRDTGDVFLMGQTEDDAGRIPWRATFCPFTETSLERKGYSRLYLRCDLEAGAWLKVEVSADDAPFRQVYLGHDQRAKTLTIPVFPTRCDSFTVRLSGKGGCRVKSMVREFSMGSEV